MLIAELRGIIVTIRAEQLTEIYFQEIMQAKEKKRKTLSQVLIDGDIGLDYCDFGRDYKARGLKIDKDSQLIITGFDNDDYYGEGYSFYRSKVKTINVSDHSYAEFGWRDELFLITFEYEFGLFKQYQINSNMDLFKSNQLNIVTSTILAKPIIKIASLMSYEGQKLKSKDDFRFEKRSLYSLIVKPKKSLFFNKMTYKNSLDVSLEMFSK
jgi:hypothetical protein